MGLLEKLRPQPRWKHTDPNVRAAAVYELGATEGEALAALAREDSDARVRRAAVSRLDDGNALADIARTDPDEEVRAEAVRALAGLAAEAGDAARASQVLHHLVELGRAREVVAIARSAASVDIRAAAVDALHDHKSLGSVSRHADDSATRLRALQRLSDPDEIGVVAIKAEHTDTAVAALERVTDPETLAAIAQRGRNKVAARRARTRLRELDDAVHPPTDDKPAASMSPEDRQRALNLIRQTELLVTIADPADAQRALSEVRVAWAELQADAEVDTELQQQFDTACDAGREAIAERQRERDAEAERARTLAMEQADRIAICDEIHQLAGPGAVDRVAELKARWDALPPMPSEYAASLTRRFQDVCRAYEERERRRLLAEAAASRLETLAGELEQLTSSDQPMEEVVARWRGLRRDAEMLREHAHANPGAAERLQQSVALLEQKEQEIQQRRTKQEQENLRRLQQICRHAEALATADALSLKAGDRALREIREALDQRLSLPSKRDRQELHARLEEIRTKLAPRVQELRDADDWQRWANLQVQEELCAAMEALKTSENIDDCAHQMRELQSRWREVAAAPRAQGEALWRRFKAGQDAVFARCETHFAAQAAERMQNLARKQELCARVEELAGSSNWVKTAAEIQQLQADWKTIGAVPRGHEKAIWERFRGACDRFFTRRQEDLRKRKDDWSANLARKEALCAQAEALADSTEWDMAAAALKRLQADWKTIGPVRKAKSEAIWQRFRAACDRFFDRYKHRDRADLQVKITERTAIVQELEALLGADPAPAETPGDLYALVQTSRSRWQQAPEVPRTVQDELSARFHDALGRLVVRWPTAFGGTDLDPEVTRSRMEKLVIRVEKLVPAAKPVALSPAEVLAQKWRERLAANTMSGGKVAENDDTKWRAAEQEIRAAQHQWARLGPVPPEVAGPLQERFTRACRRFYDQRKRTSVGSAI
jgi:hypothetical protein